MNDVYSNLVSQYGSSNVSKTSNGTYEVSYSGTKIIVPENLNENAYVVSYTPGYGDTTYNRSLINQYFTDNQLNNAILVIDSGSSSISNATEIGYNTLTSLGCNVDGAIATGFSYSAPSSINAAAKFSIAHPDVATTCISIDGTSPEHNVYYASSTSDAYSGVNPTGTGDNFSVILVDGQFDHLRQTSKFSNSGITTYNLSTTVENYRDNNQNCHDGASIDVMQFIVPYILGKNSSVNSSKGYYLRDGNNNTVDMSLLRDTLDTGSSSNSVILTDLSGTKEDEYISAINLNGNLSNLSDLKLLNVNTSSTSYVSSDLQYVCDSMNNIRGVLKNSASYSNIKKMSTQVSGGIFDIISSYISYYMEVVNKLYSNLSSETEAIVSYAQYIVDVDNALANEVPKTSDDPSNPKAPYTPSDDGNEPDDEDIILSGDDVIEHTYADGHKILVKVDNDKVVKINYQYNLDNEANYKTILNKIYASFEDKSIIEKIFVKDNKVMVILKDSYCQTLTINDINIPKEV